MNKDNIIIFTDLDGSLLDHNEYSYSVAKPLLDKLKEFQIPLIFNSSKTQMELLKLHGQLQLDTPYIIENGAAVIFNPDSAEKYLSVNKEELMLVQDNYVKTFAKKRSEILNIANDLKQRYQLKYLGFNDLSMQQVAEMTQLNIEDAYAAKQRAFSEPIVWRDTQEKFSIFKDNLSQQQIETQSGGRFIHLGSHCSKGDAMQWLVNHWKVSSNKNKTVIALGDSMNDISMLNAADYALVVKNKDDKLAVKGKIKTLYSIEKGTVGWVELLEPLLNLE